MGINRQLRLAAHHAKSQEEFNFYNGLLARSWSMTHEDGSYFSKLEAPYIFAGKQLGNKAPKPNMHTIKTFLDRCKKHGLLDENDRVAQAWTKEPGQITLVPVK